MNRNESKRNQTVLCIEIWGSQERERERAREQESKRAREQEGDYYCVYEGEGEGGERGRSGRRLN